MGSKWRTVRFQELIDEGVLQIGDGYRAKVEELGGVGPIFLRAGQVTDTAIEFDGTERFRIERTDAVRSKLSCAGDTVITTKGNSTGRTAYVTNEMPQFVYSPHLSYWRSADHQKLVPGILRYWSRGDEFVGQLHGMMESTDMAPYLSLTDQRRLTLTLPDPDTQRAIAGVLGALDDKIAANRRLSRTLEGLGRAVFRSWFVDFDPVTANAAGRRPVGLSAAAAKLFPSAFTDSPLGPVPKGWRAAPLPDVIEVNPTRRLSAGTIAPYLDMGNMPTNSARVLGWVDRPAGSGMRFQNGDTLVARITPCLENGKTAFVDFLPDGQIGWGSTEYIVLRSKPPLPPEFAYLLARTDEFRGHAVANMTGSSGRQRVPAECLRTLQVAMPPAELAEEFGRRVRPLFAGIKARAEQSRTLAALRDALLPRLLSGELRVRAAERQVGRAT